MGYLYVKAKQSDNIRKIVGKYDSSLYDVRRRTVDNSEGRMVFPVSYIKDKYTHLDGGPILDGDLQ